MGEWKAGQAGAADLSLMTRVGDRSSLQTDKEKPKKTPPVV